MPSPLESEDWVPFMLLIWGYAVWDRDASRYGRAEEIYVSEGRRDRSNDPYIVMAHWDHTRSYLDTFVLGDATGERRAPEFWCCPYLVQHEYSIYEW